MSFKRLIFSICIGIVLALSLYLLIAFNLLQDPKTPVSMPTVMTEQTKVTASAESSALPVIDKANLEPQDSSSSSDFSVGQKLIEVFGQITNRDNRPIENVLITEERYFFATRSDVQGNYKLVLDIPRNRYPVLQILSSGYSGKRIRLDKSELMEEPLHHLDIKLEDDVNAVVLRGWVGNENGISLEGVRVELLALNSNIIDSYNLTVFTDYLGNYSFDGVRAGESYKLTANLTPKYPVYQNNDLLITQNNQQANIVMKSLKFVDVDGMILDRAATPIANFEIYVSNVTTGVHSRKIVSDSSGFFSLKDFPLGEVSLATRGSEFYKITGLVLADTEYRNMVLTIDRGNHYLSGWISDENGAALDKAMITIDRTFHEGPVEYLHYRSQRTNSSGKFVFKALGQGDYRVIVYALGYQKTELMYHLSEPSNEIQIVLSRTEP